MATQDELTEAIANHIKLWRSLTPGLTCDESELVDDIYDIIANEGWEWLHEDSLWDRLRDARNDGWQEGYDRGDDLGRSEEASGY